MIRMSRRALSRLLGFGGRKLLLSTLGILLALYIFDSFLFSNNHIPLEDSDNHKQSRDKDEYDHLSNNQSKKLENEHESKQSLTKDPESKYLNSKDPDTKSEDPDPKDVKSKDLETTDMKHDEVVDKKRIEEMTDTGSTQHEEESPQKTSAQSDKAEEKKEGNATRCGLSESCPSGKVAYLLQSGLGRDDIPTICFNGQYAVSPELKNGQRGLNVVIINDKTLKVENVKFFDTWEGEKTMVPFLKSGIKDNYLILIASFDEASISLTDEHKHWLHIYGCTVIDRLKFRDNIVIIGQRGLTRGTAIEKIQERDPKKAYADSVRMSGCLSVPMGKLRSIDVEDVSKKSLSVIRSEMDKANCPLDDKCGNDSFPVRLYTGHANKKAPKICVNGRYVLGGELKNAGRGFNVVIVDPYSKQVVRHNHYDTYKEDSSNLEIFLEMVHDNEVVLIVTHDDSSRNLNLHAQKVLERLGSTMINKMSFRDVWAFAGQYGINGSSTIEELHSNGKLVGFPEPIDKHVCVPRRIQGKSIVISSSKNEERRVFCSNHTDFGDFCTNEKVDQPLLPIPLPDKYSGDDKIFSVPIIIIPGTNKDLISSQLESLLKNPGIKPDMVTVMYDEKFEEISHLAKVFKFNSLRLAHSTEYLFQFHKAFAKVWELYPKVEYVIVLEEGVIVAGDFIHFLSQCFDALSSDATLSGVSAWNENGYQESSGLLDVAYRVNTFPGFGFLMKKSFYENEIKSYVDECCMSRAWYGWKIGLFEMIVPDVSRVQKRPIESQQEQLEFTSEYFERKRLTSQGTATVLTNAKNLTKVGYEKHLVSLIESSVTLDVTHASDCLQEKALGFYIPATNGKAYSIYYEQSSEEDFQILKKLCKCFKLFDVAKRKPRGLHNGLMRFSYGGNTMLLIGSKTIYFKYKPTAAKMIRLTAELNDAPV